MATLNQGLGVKAGGSGGGGGGVTNMVSPQQSGGMFCYLPRANVTANEIYGFGPYDAAARVNLAIRIATTSTTTLAYNVITQLQPTAMFRLTPGASVPEFKGTLYVKSFTDMAAKGDWCEVVLIAVDMSDNTSASALPITITSLGGITATGSLTMTNDEFTISIASPPVDTAYYIGLQIDTSFSNVQFGAYASFEQTTALV